MITSFYRITHPTRPRLDRIMLRLISSRGILWLILDFWIAFLPAFSISYKVHPVLLALLVAIRGMASQNRFLLFKSLSCFLLLDCLFFQHLCFNLLVVAPVSLSLCILHFRLWFFLLIRFLLLVGILIVCRLFLHWRLIPLVLQVSLDILPRALSSQLDLALSLCLGSFFLLLLLLVLFQLQFESLVNCWELLN